MARSHHWPAFLRSPRYWVMGVVAVAGLALLYHQVDIEQVRTKAGELPGWLCVLLLFGLPLVGFPATALHVGAGVRFGVPLGLALVWLSILFHLLASYGLVHWHRNFFACRFKSIREKIPQGAHAPVTLFAILIPGAPYFAQNYVLPIIGVPLRIYLGIALPIHAVRSTVSVIFGGQSHDLTAGRGLVLLAYAALILLASWWALRRLKMALANQPPAAGGRKQPA